MGGARVGDDARENGAGGDPDGPDGNGYDPEEEDHPLRVQADELLVAGAVRLRAEGIKAGGEALVHGVPGYVGGHGAEGDGP